MYQQYSLQEEYRHSIFIFGHHIRAFELPVPYSFYEQSHCRQFRAMLPLEFQGSHVAARYPIFSWGAQPPN